MATPIELIASHLEDLGDCEVLVPEQCMRLYMNGRVYHVTVEDITEPDEVDTVHGYFTEVNK